MVQKHSTHLLTSECQITLYLFGDYFNSRLDQNLFFLNSQLWDYFSGEQWHFRKKVLLVSKYWQKHLKPFNINLQGCMMV